MKITVAICTWNRAALLDRTLDEMGKLRIPAGVDWEVLVVNNNCSDHTDEVLAGHAGRLPVRRLFEPRQGHSHARNCAIDAATGELILWTDDDVVVAPEWLAAYAAAAEAYPEASYFGGPIEPWFGGDRPAWMLRHWKLIEGIYVLRDYGPEVRPLASHESPAGANMAFRTDGLRKLRFDVNLGRVAASLSGADDTDMIERFQKDGQLGIWVGDARVKHFLPAERLTEDFYQSWYEGAGRTEIRQHGLAKCPQLFGMPRWALLKYLRAQIKTWCLAPGKSERWLISYRESATMLGFLLEARERLKLEATASLRPVENAVAELSTIVDKSLLS